MTEKEITSGVSTECLPATPTEAIEILKDASPPSEPSPKVKDNKTRRKRKRRRKPVRIGDALRCEGLDERDVAQKLKEVIDRQTLRSGSDSGNDKLLAEMLMNCFRHLDEAPPRQAARKNGKVPAKLLHDIPRPQRAAKSKDEKQKGTER
jgi:hypothetical protein